jgi:hypothetical protein
MMMSDETKQEEKKECGKNIFSVMLKSILGLVFIALGVYTLTACWGDFLILIKGSLGLFLMLAGIITLAIARE